MLCWRIANGVPEEAQHRVKDRFRFQKLCRSIARGMPRQSPFRKEFPRRLDIARNLRAQRVGPRKLLFVANPRMQANFHRPARDILAESKHMALDRDSRSVKR